MSFDRIRHIIKKELIQIRRDPRMMKLIIISPIMQLIIFGYAITSEVRNVSTAILDMDNTLQSREFVDRFAANPRYFDISYRLTSPAEIDFLLDSGKAQLVVWIPKEFGADIARNRNAEVSVLLDAVDSSTASTIASYVNAITAGYSEKVILSEIERKGGGTIQPLRIEPRVRAWYNPELKSVNFLVPGVLAMILMLVTMLLTSLAVVREREVGTLEQIIVTPIRSIELMIGKMIPFAMVGYINIIMIVAAAALWFKVPIRGSLVLLFGLSAFFLLANLAMGLLVSTVSKTQQQAMMLSFFIMQPSILLSGFIFPINNMPAAIQYLTYLIPLRYYLEIVRGIFLRGVGPAALWPQAASLLLLGGLLMIASALRFTKKVE